MRHLEVEKSKKEDLVRCEVFIEVEACGFRETELRRRRWIIFCDASREDTCPGVITFQTRKNFDKDLLIVRWW
jgi:hypothetical protein